MKKPRKKLGYKEYEGLLAEAHKKLEILAGKYNELQTYFIGYVEFNDHNVKFNDWINLKIKEMEHELHKNESANERNLETSTADQG